MYFFFVLSGFMLTYSYSDKEVNIKKFYLTRLFKFYPTYIFSLLLLFVYSIKYKEKLVYSIFMIQSLIWDKATNQNYNYSAWYLSVLAFLILLFPFFLILLKNFPKYSIYSAILLSAYNLIFNKYSDNSYIYYLINYFPLMRIASFLLGMVLSYKLKNISTKKYFSFLIIFYFAALMLFIQYNKVILYSSTVISISFIPLITFLFLDKGFFSNFMGNKIFVYLGCLSYSMYILHVSIYHIYRKYFHEIDSVYHFFIFFIIIFVISIFSKLFIENMFYRYLSKRYLKENS